MDARFQSLCIDGESATAFVRWAQKASKSGKSDGSEVVRKEMIKDMLSYTDLSDVEKNLRSCRTTHLVNLVIRLPTTDVCSDVCGVNLDG